MEETYHLYSIEFHIEFIVSLRKRGSRMGKADFQECPKCSGVMMVEYNPKIPLERNEHCFRCGYFHNVELHRTGNHVPDINFVKDFEQLHFTSISEADLQGTPLKDEKGNYQFKEQSLPGYGCYLLARVDGSSEFSTFSKPVTAEIIQELMETLKDPFYDQDKSFIAAWDIDKNEQIVLFGDAKNIPYRCKLSFKEWSEKKEKYKLEINW